MESSPNKNDKLDEDSIKLMEQDLQLEKQQRAQLQK